MILYSNFTRPVIVKVGLLLADDVENICMTELFQRQRVWVHTTSLAPPLYIELHVPSQENERSCIFAMGFNCA